MTKNTIDDQGKAHKGKGLATGGGEYTTPLTSEPGSTLSAPLTVPARPVPTGNLADAEAQRAQLKKAAAAYANELMRQNPEFFELVRDAGEDAVQTGSVSYPEATLTVHEATEEDFAFSELTCPWCGNTGTGDSFYEVSVSERWDRVDELSQYGTSLKIDADNDANSNGIHMACSRCNNPVSLPDSIDVEYC